MGNFHSRLADNARVDRRSQSQFEEPPPTHQEAVYGAPSRRRIRDLAPTATPEPLTPDPEGYWGFIFAIIPSGTSMMSYKAGPFETHASAVDNLRAADYDSAQLCEVV